MIQVEYDYTPSAKRIIQASMITFSKASQVLYTPFLRLRLKVESSTLPAQYENIC